MANITEDLVKFARETSFEDLPSEVIRETKRVLLDSIGCAIGGLSIDKGRMAVQAANLLGGSGRASIIGTGQKVSYFQAAFANGELIQALDYDAIIFPAIHVTPFVIAAPLALSEGLKASGRELIRAVAIALEMSARFGKAFPKKAHIVDGKVIPPPVRGYSWTIFGGTAAVGLLLGFDAGRMANALGIAGVVAPVSARQKFMTTVPIHTAKHLMAGWVCAAEVMSGLLAEVGYVGDTTVFEGDYGFWRFSGYPYWEPSAVIEGLGEHWQFVGGTNYKVYPCCGVFRTALDCFIHLIDENNIRPEEIEEVRVYVELETFGVQPVWQNTAISSPVDAQFSVAYNFAVAAHRLKYGEWQAPETMGDPAILHFMKKVIVNPHPDFPKDAAASGDLGRVEIFTRGKVLEEERLHAKGSPYPMEYRMTDDELVAKFREQASGILRRDKIDRSVNRLLDLEKQLDMSEVMQDLLSP